MTNSDRLLMLYEIIIIVALKTRLTCYVQSRWRDFALNVNNYIHTCMYVYMNVYASCSYGVANESATIAVGGVKCPDSSLWHLMRCNVDYDSSNNDCSHQRDVAVVCSEYKLYCTHLPMHTAW